MLHSLIPLQELYHLNTRLFLNCISECTEETVRLQPNASTNNMLFLICHLLDARYYIARLMGVKAKNPYQALFDGINSVQDLKETPSLAELRLTWMQISEELDPCWKKVDKNLLQKKPAIDLPMEKKDRLSAITFLLHHEAYHIGQLALLRKYHGLAAMKYS